MFSSRLLLLGVLLAAYAANACREVQKGSQYQLQQEEGVLHFKKQLKAHKHDLYIDLNPLDAQMHISLVKLKVCAEKPSGVEISYKQSSQTLHIHRIVGSDHSVPVDLHFHVEYYTLSIPGLLEDGPIGISDGVNY